MIDRRWALWRGRLGTMTDSWAAGSAGGDSAGTGSDVPDPAELLAVAVDAVRGAGELIRRELPSVAAEVSTKSTPTDVVTGIDRAAERFVIDLLLAARPGDGVLGEEGGERTGEGPVRWVLDPVDGTVNLLYGLPSYAVSLAAEVAGRAVAGAVLNVATGQLWTATAGGGAHRDGQPVRSSPKTDLRQALVGTGFSYDATVRRRQAAVLSALIGEIRDIRRIGAAAVDLCYVADGRLDAHYEVGLHRWDFAAAGLIAAEAGVLVTGLDGRPPGEDLVIAAPPALHSQLHDRLSAVERTLASSTQT